MPHDFKRFPELTNSQMDFYYDDSPHPQITEDISVRVIKVTANANDIFVDYFLIVPIGDGESFPQDLSHSALRGRGQFKRGDKR